MADEPKEPLLTDDEAAALLASEYAALGAPVDQVAQARVWARIEGEVARRRRQSRRAAFGAALGVAAALALVVIGRQSGDPVQRDKGGTGSVPAELSAFVFGADGKMTLLGRAERPAPGTTLVFEVHAAAAGVYAIALTEGDAGPRLATTPAALSPSATMVKTGMDLFAYRVEAGRAGRACVIAATAFEALAPLTAALSESLATLPSSACVSW